MASLEPNTPTRDAYQHNAPNITAEQKQRMIDNLQIELTTRARNLRNQAAKQAGSLQNKIEHRVMKVPAQLRKMTMGDLLDKLEESPKKPSIPAVSSILHLPGARKAIYDSSTVVSASPYRAAGKKRTSDEMIGSDKENQGANIDVPKKRSRVAAVPKSATEMKAARTGSRNINPSQVLSPKSNNSRTLPHSPLKAATNAARFYGSRPASPVKPQYPAATSAMPPPEKPRMARPKTTTTKTTAAPAAAPRSKRGAVPTTSMRPENNRIASDSSTTSATSTCTTIITKKAPAKKGMMSKMQGMASAAGRRVVGVKKELTAATPAESGRRVLRSRK